MWAGEVDECDEAPDIEETICKTRRHMDDWSSGLHVIANIFAFVKFGVLGWQKFCGWGLDSNRDDVTLKTLTESLHKLMNISLQPSPLIKAIKSNVKELWDKFSRNKQSLTTISENDEEPQPFKLDKI